MKKIKNQTKNSDRIQNAQPQNTATKNVNNNKKPAHKYTTTLWCDW